MKIHHLFEIASVIRVYNAVNEWNLKDGGNCTNEKKKDQKLLNTFGESYSVIKIQNLFKISCIKWNLQDGWKMLWMKEKYSSTIYLDTRRVNS